MTFTASTAGFCSLEKVRSGALRDSSKEFAHITIYRDAWFHYIQCIRYQKVREGRSVLGFIERSLNTNDLHFSNV